MDLYQKLDVGRKATDKEIRTAYRKKVRVLHPDHSTGDDAARFREVQEAYEVLSDAKARRAYDQKLESQVASAGTRVASRQGVYEVFPGGHGPRETVREVNRGAARDTRTPREARRSPCSDDPLEAEWARIMEWIFDRRF